MAEFPDNFTLTILPSDFDDADYDNGGWDPDGPSCAGYKALKRMFPGERVLLGYNGAIVGADEEEIEAEAGHGGFSAIQSGTRYSISEQDARKLQDMHDEPSAEADTMTIYFYRYKAA